MKFQDLDVSIENRKGSVRKWHDPHSGEDGTTKMLYPYGYIRKSKGTDGDHVDVYVGPNPQASMAFIINQMKKPTAPDQHHHTMKGGETGAAGPGPTHIHTMPGGGFTGPPKTVGNTQGDHTHSTPKGDTGGEVFKSKKQWTKFDEQKVMIGFNSAKDAKEAYLKHYNDPRFFGSMKAMPMAEFKEKVLMKENHGKKVASFERLKLERPKLEKAELEKLKLETTGLPKPTKRVARSLTGKQKALLGAGLLAAGGTAAYLATRKKKTSSGDMIEYFNKHPQKLKEYKERQARKRKSAGKLEVLPGHANEQSKAAADENVLQWVQEVAKTAAKAKIRVTAETPVTPERQIAATSPLSSPGLAVQSSVSGAAAHKVAQLVPGGTAGGALQAGTPPQPPSITPPQQQRSVTGPRPPSPLSAQRAAAMQPAAGMGAGAPAGNAVARSKAASDLDISESWPPDADPDRDYIRDHRREKLKMKKESQMQSRDLATAGKLIKRPDWKLPRAQGLPKIKAVRPEPGTASKVAALAIECGLEPWQVEIALHAGAELGKEAGLGGLLAKGLSKARNIGWAAQRTARRGARAVQGSLSGQGTKNLAKATAPKKPFSLGKAALGVGAVGTVGAGLYGGKKAIDTASDLVTRQHGPVAIRRQMPGMPVIGR
jgi:hypothetical protein